MTRAIVSFVVLALWALLICLMPSACTLPEPVDADTGCYIDGAPSLCFPWIIRVPVIPDGSRPSGDAAADGSRDGASDARSDASDASSDAGDSAADGDADGDAT